MARAKVIQSIFELKDKFSPKLNEIKKGSAQYRRELRDLKKVGAAAFKGLAIGVAAMGTATVAAGVGFTALVNKTAQAGDRIDKMSQKLGLSRQGFQELDYVLDQNGMSIDSLGMGMKSLAQQMYGVQTKAKGSSELFKELGLDASVAGESQEEAFKKVVSAFQGMEEGPRKAVLAQKMFGRNGQEMLPMLNASQGSIEALTDKYNKLGSAMSDEAVTNSVDFIDTLATLKASMKGFFQSLSSPALGHFTIGMQWLIDKMPMIKQFGVDAFESIKNSIANNLEKFDSVRTAFNDIKESIMGAFGPGGEGGGAIAWLMDTAIPALVGGIASVLQIASDTYFFFKDNWFFMGTIVYGIVGAWTAYHLMLKAILIKKYALTAAQWALNVAMTANPIGLIIAGIGALIGVSIFLIKQWHNVGLAGKKLWNGLVSVVEWGVNFHIKAINLLIDIALKKINLLIRGINKVTGKNIGELSFGIQEVDFGAAKLDTEGQKFEWKKGKDETNFEDVLKGHEKEQALQIKTQQASNSDLTNALNNNTDTLQATRGGGNTINVTVNASDLTAEEIADKLIPRIERKLFA